LRLQTGERAGSEQGQGDGTLEGERRRCEECTSSVYSTWRQLLRRRKDTMPGHDFETGFDLCALGIIGSRRFDWNELK
jgi:hypothetical protein